VPLGVEPVHFWQLSSNFRLSEKLTFRTNSKRPLRGHKRILQPQRELREQAAGPHLIERRIAPSPAETTCAGFMEGTSRLLSKAAIVRRLSSRVGTIRVRMADCANPDKL
jgi:hypothetical protein